MTDLDAILPRLIDAALVGRRDDELMGILCEDLLARGMPILRASISTEFLHPTLEFRVSRWSRGRGVETQTFDRKPYGASDSQAWLRSPFHRLVEREERMLRRRIDEASIAEFPVLADFAAMGGTDYLALRQPIGSGAAIGEVREMFASWVTDRPNGFLTEEISLFERLQPYLVLAVRSVSNVWIARALLETYLGRDAARRVLAGDIVRGRTETTRKVIWYSDLRDFTRLTDRLPQAEMLRLLNDYAEPLVDAVTRESGEVLKFIGDGILAIFDSREPEEACAAALRAWEQAHAAVATVSSARAARGAMITRPYLALHEGEVLYGNFGGPTRLDFTVLGPAVNEAARIAALCRSLDQTLIISEAFASTSGSLRARLVGLGRYALRGVGRPQMLWTLDADAAA
jgi:adenylate cyclase